MHALDGNRWNAEGLVPYQEIKDIIIELYPLIRLNNGAHDTAKTYQLPGFRGDGKRYLLHDAEFL